MPSSCRLRPLLLCLLAVAAAGCTLGLGQQAASGRTYWLAPVDMPADAPEVALGRVRASAVPGLDTDRMLALDADRQLVPYAGARWNGRIPELVASLTERSLGREGSHGPDLHLEVRRFFVERRTPPGQAVIELAARLAEAVASLADMGWAFTLVAAGLLLFGLFSLILARWRIIPDIDPSGRVPSFRS